MKILKNITTYFTILLILLACEQDDICVEPTTPYLIIRFYNVDFPESFKKVVDIKVELEGIDGFYEDGGLTINTLTDSIAIPVKVTEDITKFKITVVKLDENDVLIENEDVFDLNYTRENLYVSRSCGYKTLYNDVLINLEDDNDNWIKIIEPTKDPLNIITQESAHVKIFH